MSVNGIELKEGQKWKTLSERVATIQDNPGAASYIFRAVYEDGWWNTVTKDGKLWTNDYNPFLRELIYDPEQVKEKLTMKVKPKSEPTKFVPPKPGDKIICNNGEEFICCTLEFLKETFHDLVAPSEIILGYNQTWSEWQSWDFNGQAEWGGLRYHIREVIPQSSEVTAHKKEEVKEEPRYKAATAEQPLYTVEEVIEAIQLVTPNEAPWNWVPEIKEHLNKVKDPQYLEYLRLKAIYE